MRLLAGQTVEAVAAVTGVDPNMLGVFHQYFFDVMDCLHATDWILDEVIGLYSQDTRPIHRSPNLETPRLGGRPGGSGHPHRRLPRRRRQPHSC